MVSVHFQNASLYIVLGIVTLAAQTDQTGAQPQEHPDRLRAGLTETSEGLLTPKRPDLINTLSAEQRGDLMMIHKMYREACEAYLTAPQDSPVILNKVGIAYHQLMDIRMALRYYERAARAKPDYAEAINNIGTIAYSQKKYGKAVRYYQRALKLSTNSASMYSNLGTAEFARKRYKEASESYMRALQIDPEVFDHKSSSGTLIQERTVEERAKFHFYLAKACAKNGNTERALAYIRKALEEGFKDHDKFRKEPEFAALQDLPEFKELMTLDPRVL